ncbi:VEG136 protein [Uncinocarpus reesii 1704]|uniref:VEG136 protein n=1 Tax=Uncinocarpus reesii (strain UAMH 1704) TaxID=336963 RepID=C4JVL1_UNCRE|nr:VEG136 protein [Uncinocarpus reesii 1704]EEP81738.1 VEG136 protein [Uncinocarpus reesii 1704]
MPMRRKSFCTHTTRNLIISVPECIYSPEAFRGSARTLIKDLEKIRPSSILDIVKSGEDMAELVPPEISGSASCASKNATSANATEDYSTGGCGSQNGRTGGNEMAEMEKRLAENEIAESRETEITLAPITKTKKQQLARTSHRNGSGSQKAVKVQTMGQCERCGYLSSQKICKACTLLEGLNKSRPQMSVEIGVEEEEGSSTLMRQMERIQISSG